MRLLTFPADQAVTDTVSARFITFEGGDGSGKSKQAALLASELARRGFDVVLTREPGGTAAAEAIRSLLLDPQTELSPSAEILLHFAARCDHLDKVVVPALERGAWVISDRFYDSTIAYQGYGLSGDVGFVTALIRRVAVHPALTIVLDVDPLTAFQRRPVTDASKDRYERLPGRFHMAVREGFRAIAQSDPERCALVDASQSIQDVHRRVLDLVDTRLEAMPAA